MIRHPGRPLRRRPWLRYLAVVLATISQLTFTVLPLVDGWHGLGAGPHVEAAGGTSHYAHSEDTCAACHVGALTEHPTPTLRLAVASELTWRTAACGPFGTAVASTSSATSFHHSRAPPTVN